MRIKQVLAAAVFAAALPCISSAVVVSNLDFTGGGSAWTVLSSSGPLSVTYELDGDSTNVGFATATGGAGTANGGSVIEQEVFAPVGFTMSNIVVTGEASGFSSWLMDGRTGLNANSLGSGGAPLTAAYSYSPAAANSGTAVVDVPFTLDASGNPAFEGVSSVFVSVQNFKGLDSVWRANNVKNLVVTADLTPIPEPASLALVGLGGMVMLSRRRPKA